MKMQDQFAGMENAGKVSMETCEKVSQRRGNNASGIPLSACKWLNAGSHKQHHTIAQAL